MTVGGIFQDGWIMASPALLSQNRILFCCLLGAPQSWLTLHARSALRFTTLTRSMLESASGARNAVLSFPSLAAGAPLSRRYLRPTRSGHPSLVMIKSTQRHFELLCQFPALLEICEIIINFVCRPVPDAERPQSIDIDDGVLLRIDRRQNCGCNGYTYAVQSVEDFYR